MLVVRRVPRRVAPVAAGLATLEMLTALVLAHTAAGGSLPSGAWLLVLGVVAYGAGLDVLGRGLSIRWAAPVMVLVQLLLHAWLMTLQPTGHAGHAGGGAVADGTLLGISPAMFAAHVVAGVIAALAWSLRRRAVEVLTSWVAGPRAAVVAPSRVPAPRRTDAAPTGVMVRITPTRGPPVRRALRLA